MIRAGFTPASARICIEHVFRETETRVHSTEMLDWQFGNSEELKDVQMFLTNKWINGHIGMTRHTLNCFTHVNVEKPNQTKINATPHFYLFDGETQFQ